LEPVLRPRPTPRPKAVAHTKQTPQKSRFRETIMIMGILLISLIPEIIRELRLS
jgi:hypothetical protein